MENVDPGITNLVQFLVDNGFHPTEAGDGETGLEEEDETDSERGDWLVPFPHVIMTVSADLLIQECMRLRELLTLIGVPVGAQAGVDYSTPYIEGTFDPCDQEALIALIGATDEDLQFH